MLCRYSSIGNPRTRSARHLCTDRQGRYARQPILGNCLRSLTVSRGRRTFFRYASQSLDGSTMTPPVLISYPALLPVYPKLYVQCFHPIPIIESSESTASPRQSQYQCLPPLSVVRASTLVDACSRRSPRIHTHCAYLRYCSYLSTLYCDASNVTPCSASGKTPSMFSTPSILSHDR
jgi:hypothetical protein